MSTDRFSLGEFSQFLDDSDGHRLAQFLQKKTGKIPPGRTIFHCDDSGRVSLNVITAPLPALLLLPETAENSNNAVESLPFTNTPKIEVDDEYVNAMLAAAGPLSSVSFSSPVQSVEQSLQATAGSNVAQGPSPAQQQLSPAPTQRPSTEKTNPTPGALSNKEVPPLLITAPVSPISAPASSISAPVSPITAPVSPVPAPVSSISAPVSPIPTSVSSIPAPVSPRHLVTLRRSGGISSADKLRRKTLNRLASLGGGRRTLIQEFENTLRTPDFEPPVCSTPMHSQPSKPTTPVQSTADTNRNTGAIEAGECTAKKTTPRSSFTLRPHDPQVYQALSEIIEVSIRKVMNERDNNVVDNNAVDNNATITSNRSNRSCSAPISQEILQYSTASNTKATQNQLPETQELLLDAQKLLKSLHQSQVPKIVIPVSQTINGINAETLGENRKSKESGLQEKSQCKRNTSQHVVNVPNKSGKYGHSQNDAMDGKENIESSCQCNVETHSLCNAQNKSQHTECDLSRQHKSQHTVQNNTRDVVINNSHHSFDHRSLHNKSNPNAQEDLNVVAQNKSQCTFNRKSQHTTKVESRSSAVINNGQRNMCDKSLPDAQEELHNTTRNKLQHVAIPESHKSAVINNSHRSLGDKSRSDAQELHDTTQNKSQRTFKRKSQHTTIIEQPNSTIINHATFTRSTNNMCPQIGPNNAASASSGEELNELRWSDVGTDDEDNVPLNLVAKTKSAARNQRSRNRSTVRRRAISPFLSTETESEAGPPPAHPLNLRRIRNESIKESKRKRPLNKAPCTPKNGEPYAPELKTQLARLTNLQILDLRKRNSLNDLFPLPARKSKNGRRRSSKKSRNEVLHAQRILEEEIQREILRRNLEGLDQGLETETLVQQETEVQQNRQIGSRIESPHQDEDIFLELLPAPDDFQDSNALKTTLKPQGDIILELINRSPRCSSLVDEQIEERVSFISPSKTKLQSGQSIAGRRRSRKRDTSELVKSYLGVRNKIPKNREINQSKRSLYSKGHSACEDETLTDNADLGSHINSDVLASTPLSHSKPKSPLHLPAPTPLTPPLPLPASSLPSPPSPQHQQETIENMYLVSPPPPFVVPTMAAIEQTEIMAPPESFLNAAAKTPASTSKSSLPEDNAVFKKPLLPAPQRRKHACPKPRVKRSFTNDNVEQESESSQSENTDVQGLRRSKRGHVPLRTVWTYSGANESNLLADMYGWLMNPKTKSSRNRSSSVVSDSNWPAVASSTPNSVLVGKSTSKNTRTKSNKSQKQHKESTFNFLGDTDVTSESTAGGGNGACISSNRVQSLSAILEIPAEETESNMESDAASVANLPPTNTKEENKKCSKTDAAPANTRKKKTKQSRKKGCQSTQSKQNNTLREATLSNSPVFEPPALSNDELFNQLKEPQSKQDTPGERPAPMSPSKERVKTKRASKTTRKPVVETNTSTGGPNANFSDINYNVLNHSRVCVPPVPPVRQLNKMFEQLKNQAAKENDDDASSTSTSTNSSVPTKKLRVRLRRMRNVEQSADSVTALTSASADNFGLLSYLKGVAQIKSVDDNAHVFMDMRCSTAGKLGFSVIGGIEYAFYDTDQAASLGYLRFQPRQKKSERRARRFHLHFVVLAGKFEFSTNREHGTFTIGDMVAINKGCRYSVENLLNEIGILMVVKK